MEKKQFHTLVGNYTCLSAEEASQLLLLEKEFPYCQVIRSLSARSTQDNNLPEKEDQLHLAAMCVTDRAVFKNIMTAAVEPRKQPVVIAEVKSESATVVIEPETLSVTSQATPQPEIQHTNSDTLFEAVLQDMEKLHNSMHVFEETVKQLESGVAEVTAPAKSSEKKKKAVDVDEELISEIKVTKKEVNPEGPKQIEQIEIIDQFIKTQPTIKGRVPSESSGNQDDLAGKNDGYNENIISETLAQILIKQGKKEKAIDILKKLIWKFPQKKAYFAAQIEELKK